jgi:hypothetical protein
LPTQLEKDEALRIECLALHQKLGHDEKIALKGIHRARHLPSYRDRLERKLTRQGNEIEKRHHERIIEGFVEVGRQRHRTVMHERQCQQRNRREQMSLGQRLDEALNKAKLLPGVSGSTIEKTAHGSDVNHEPPPIAGAQYTPAEESVVDTFTRRATRLVQQLEREVG